ncbi:hypothetical protein Cal7507_6029 [Calothrix sp. PCC 7507]|nr:hypothetical protein Cal7507_6029 [Calothrix sp. PCC 7507]
MILKFSHNYVENTEVEQLNLVFFISVITLSNTLTKY